MAVVGWTLLAPRRYTPTSYFQAERGRLLVESDHERTSGLREIGSKHYPVPSSTILVVADEDSDSPAELRSHASNRHRSQPMAGCRPAPRRRASIDRTRFVLE